MIPLIGLVVGVGAISASRWLLVAAEMERDVDIPYEDAIDILKRTAGPRLHIIER